MACYCRDGDALRYEDMSKEELIEIIKAKNDKMNALAGATYVLSRDLVNKKGCLDPLEYAPLMFKLLAVMGYNLDELKESYNDMKKLLEIDVDLRKRL